MTAQRDSAAGATAALEAKQTSDKTNYGPLATSVKRLIVALAIRGFLTASVATWLINVLGLRGA